MTPKYILTILLTLMLATMAYAVLPPGSYEKLTAEAREVVKIRVVGVDKEEPSPANGVFEINYRAEVVEVWRSASGLATKSLIGIRATNTDKMMMGPGFPKVLAVGWVGKAYLNGPDEEGFYLPAAYSRSFAD